MTISAPIKRGRESGQALLISLGILLLLFISIPVIIFTGQSGIRHQTRSQRQEEGRDIAQQGVAYAAQSFAAHQEEWDTGVAAGGNFTALFALVNGCPGAPALPAGTPFKLSCAGKLPTNDPQLQPYQVRITATAMVQGPDGNIMPGSAIQTILSQKTLGASLANGLRASAALSVVQAPTGPGAPATALSSLTVHWGPIVYFDPNPAAPAWQLTGLLDKILYASKLYPGYPRKFSTTPITSANFVRSPNAIPATAGESSDQREYWAHASISPPPAIDESSYTLKAASELLFPNVNCNPVPIACSPPNASGLWGDGTGVFDAGGGTVVFTGYVVPANSVIYVHGNALINSPLDMGVGGAFIATGTVTLDSTGGGQLPNATIINIPITAPQEYPYIPPSAPAGWQMPCYAQYYNAVTASPPILPTCLESDIAAALGSPVNFRGFLWAKGGLVVNGSAATPFVIVGAVQVGDRLTNPTATTSGSTLTILLDAGTNQSIFTVAN